MRKIRIAQIGINLYSHGGEIFETLKSLPDYFEVVGYTLVENEAEISKHKLGVFEGVPYLTLDEILSDPTIEAVTVETDEVHLLKYAIMAAEAGKHIHMEKPGSQSVADFERLVSIMKRTGKTLTLGYMYRYHPAIMDLINSIKSGEFGRVFSVDADMSVAHPDDMRLWQKTFKGGMTFYLGCHLIDLVLLILGDPSEIIPINFSAEPNRIATEDFGMTVFKYDNAVATVRECGAVRGGHTRRSLKVCGSLRTVEICPLEYFPKGVVYPDMVCDVSESNDRAGVNRRTSEVFHRYRDMMIAFHDYALGNKQTPYSLDYELKLFKTVMRACGFEV